MVPTVQTLREEHRHHPVHALEGIKVEKQAHPNRTSSGKHPLANEWGSCLVIPTPERAMKADYAVRGRPRRHRRERPWTQFHSLQCCLVCGHRPALVDPRTATRVASKQARDRQGQSTIQDKQPSKKRYKKVGVPSRPELRISTTTH